MRSDVKGFAFGLPVALLAFGCGPGATERTAAEIEAEAEHAEAKAELAKLTGARAARGIFDGSYSAATNGEVYRDDEGRDWAEGIVTVDLPKAWKVKSLSGTATVSNGHGLDLWTGPLAWSSEDAAAGRIVVKVDIAYEDDLTHRELLAGGGLAGFPAEVKLHRVELAGGEVKSF